MKNFVKATLLIAVALYFASCNKETKTETNTTQTATDSLLIEHKSADSLGQLHDILLQSLKTKDKNLYLSYCFTQEQEDKIAQMLNDEKKKKYFQREFGFSIHEEVAYFENINKYIDKMGIDLNMIELPLIETFDYDRSNYAPIVLKESIIPIIQEGLERDIVYVAIQIDGKWFFTSELSL
ncbi:MAG: hypothetical protein ACKVOU_00560 [Cytophagales bacterium]